MLAVLRPHNGVKYFLEEHSYFQIEIRMLLQIGFHPKRSDSHLELGVNQRVSMNNGA